MPDYRPNPITRVVAVAALIAAFFLIVFVIASSGGSSDDGDDSPQVEEEASGPTAKGARAVEAGVWIVREGDTLAQISEETGIDVDELLAMNPDLDPQALIQGQRIALR
jgi:LysM repeat protein